MNEPITVHVFYTVPTRASSFGMVKTIKVNPTETIDAAFTRYGGDASAIIGCVIGGRLEWNTGKVIKTN